MIEYRLTIDTLGSLLSRLGNDKITEAKRLELQILIALLERLEVLAAASEALATEI